MLEPHLQILSDAEGKAACPPLVEVEDMAVVCYLLHNKPCHAIQHRCIQISSKSIRTGMYVFLGFDVEDGHTSKTCPTPWRRANHQEGFNRNNVGQYIGAGYDACTKAMHKSQLPNM